MEEIHHLFIRALKFLAKATDLPFFSFSLHPVRSAPIETIFHIGTCLAALFDISTSFDFNWKPASTDGTNYPSNRNRQSPYLRSPGNTKLLKELSTFTFFWGFYFFFERLQVPAWPALCTFPLRLFLPWSTNRRFHFLLFAWFQKRF